MANASMTLPQLDGAQDAPLAPIRGPDDRRSLPSPLFVKRPAVFVTKFLFAMAVVAGCYALIAVGPPWYVVALAVCLLGFMYAHLVELQHEALHEHSFNSRKLNRLFGFACGVFMLSSYSHYKYEHLRHHASLGKLQNKEFFNYRFSALGTPVGLVRAAWHLGRYADVAHSMLNSVLRRAIVTTKHVRADQQMSVEYRVFATMVLAATTFTVVTGDLIFVIAWLIPILAIAEPVHFLIELPEHFGLNTQSNPDVLGNTRSITTGRIVHWFTNGNNLHTAHHYHQGVPMVNVRKLDELVSSRYQVVESSYRSFYRKVVRGKIKYEDLGDTCMTR